MKQIEYIYDRKIQSCAHMNMHTRIQTVAPRFLIYPSGRIALSADTQIRSYFEHYLQQPHTYNSYYF